MNCQRCHAEIEPTVDGYTSKALYWRELANAERFRADQLAIDLAATQSALGFTRAELEEWIAHHKPRTKSLRRTA